MANILLGVTGSVAAVKTPWGWTEQRPPVQETVDRWTRALQGRQPFRVQIVEGLGHHWPGGKGTLSRRIFGPPRPDVPANDLIWEVFRHTP